MKLIDYFHYIACIAVSFMIYTALSGIEKENLNNLGQIIYEAIMIIGSISIFVSLIALMINGLANLTIKKKYVFGVLIIIILIFEFFLK